MALPLLEAPDRPDDGPPRVEPERRLGRGGRRAASEVLDVHAARDDRPAGPDAVGLRLDAESVGVGDDRVDRTRDHAPRETGGSVRAGETPLAGDEKPGAAKPSGERADERGAPLVAVHDVDARRAQKQRRADHAGKHPRPREALPELERRDGDPRRAQLVGELAAAPQGVDVRGEVSRVEVPQHLLEVPLRAAREEQRGKIRDPRHAGAARAYWCQGGPAPTTAGSPRLSTWRRIVTMSPIRM